MRVVPAFDVLEDGEAGLDLNGRPRNRVNSRRADGITGGELPDLAHALELADGEGVEADQLARLPGMPLARPPVPGVPQPATRTLRQQPDGLNRVRLEDREPGPAGRQAYAPPPRGTVLGPPAAASGAPGMRRSGHLPGPRADRHSLDQPRRLGRDLAGTARPAVLPARMQSIGPLALDALLPSRAQRPEDAHIPTDGRVTLAPACTRCTTRRRSPCMLSSRAIGPLPPCGFLGDHHTGKVRAVGPLVVPSAVSTLLRVRTR